MRQGKAVHGVSSWQVVAEHPCTFSCNEAINGDRLAMRSLQCVDYEPTTLSCTSDEAAVYCYLRHSEAEGLLMLMLMLMLMSRL